MATKIIEGVKVHSYVIHDITEECYCEYCGCGLLRNDKAIEDEDQEHVWCSTECAKNDITHWL